jgi:uncharacterized ferritin-like protein (DUF455 family)
MSVVLNPTARFSVLSLPGSLGSVGRWAREIFETKSMEEKCEKVKLMHAHYFDGRLEVSGEPESVPDYPGRPEQIHPPGTRTSMKGTAPMLHGICHAESYAVDLFLDLLARFGNKDSDLPKEFYDDFMEVCLQEAKHFTVWQQRLCELGVEYGSLPAHDGLWRAAYETRGDLLARLAVINMVHEARGLDTYPLSRKKLVNGRKKQP